MTSGLYPTQTERIYVKNTWHWGDYSSHIEYTHIYNNLLYNTVQLNMEPYPLVHPTSLAISFRLRGSTKIVTGASTSVDMNNSAQNKYNPIQQRHWKYLCDPVDSLGMTNPTLKSFNEKYHKNIHKKS
jgi:hypothetical protein